MDGKKPNFGNIGNFLKKFTAFTPSDFFIKEVVVKTVKEFFNVDILQADLHTKQGTVFLRCAPILKQEISMQKTALLARINEQLENTQVKDIV